MLQWFFWIIPAHPVVSIAVGVYDKRSMGALMSLHPGTLWWITGLSGAGKTTVGRMLAARLRANGIAVIHLDGDELRCVMDATDRLLPDERRALATQYARLCQLIVSQGVDVVCSTISLFRAVQEWNREHVHQYREVVLQVPMAVLRQRDSKGLYANAGTTNTGHVAGVQFEVEWPERPDIEIVNDGTRSIEQIVTDIISLDPRYQAAHS
ncbi:adenylyl-sulfate kinase [Thalassobaculum sp.]|uniref:adenylyl-sulfate kinase n=1 Tax=Thalassobaculum sp. TaxID=2022740 RepID=UPI0032EC2187